jgi:hypothetical protein
MPVFFLAPIWLLLLLVGLGLWIPARSRFLSAYLILCSTLGLITALILSTVLLLAMGLLASALQLKGTAVGIVIILVYLVSIGAGGVLGVLFGIILARKLNRVMGWDWPLT